MRRALQGDRDALGELYERHHARVRRYAALRMGARLRDYEASIDDVAQEAWAQALEALLAGRFDPDRAPGAFRCWLAALVANRVRVRARRAQRRPEDERLPTETTPAPGPRQATHLGQQEVFARVEEALLVLDARAREVVCLRHLCGMSSDEVRAELGLARPEQARWLVARALKRLRDRLGSAADEWARFYG